jgi:hypothetical protein
MATRRELISAVGELQGGDPGVDLGGLKALMAKHGLDEPDIGPAFEHQRGGGVAQQMA